MRRDTHGFTLVELMVVIAIIAVIAAIAIPNLIESRKAANERSAIGLMRAVHAAEILFKDRDIDRDMRHQYSRMSGPLGPVLGVAQLPDSRPLAGYDWGIIDDPTEPDEDTFVAVAAPVVPGKSGDRCFCVDETGVIRWAPADAISPQSVEPPYAFFRTWAPLDGAYTGASAAPTGPSGVPIN